MSSRAKGVVNHSVFKVGMDKKEWCVFTTARRTEGMVCRKKGKRVGARALRIKLNVSLISLVKVREPTILSYLPKSR